MYENSNSIFSQQIETLKLLYTTCIIMPLLHHTITEIPRFSSSKFEYNQNANKLVLRSNFRIEYPSFGYMLNSSIILNYGFLFPASDHETKCRVGYMSNRFDDSTEQPTHHETVTDCVSYVTCLDTTTVFMMVKLVKNCTSTPFLVIIRLVL